MKSSFWLLAIGFWPEGDADIEIPGLERNATVVLARFMTPPVFGVALSPITQRIIPQKRSKVKAKSAKLWKRFALLSYSEARVLRGDLD